MRVALALVSVLVVAAAIGAFIGMSTLSDDAPVAEAQTDDGSDGDNGGGLYVYTVKFVCVEEEPFFLSQTDINIHNPNRGDVKFLKKGIGVFEFVGPGGSTGEAAGLTPIPASKDLSPPGPLVSQELPPNWATGLNCDDIASLISGEKSVGEPLAQGGAAGGFTSGEGLVVIESDQPLDVWAVYTSFAESCIQCVGGEGQGAGGGLTSVGLDIEQVEATRIEGD